MADPFDSRLATPQKGEIIVRKEGTTTATPSKAKMTVPKKSGKSLRLPMADIGGSTS